MINILVKIAWRLLSKHKRFSHLASSFYSWMMYTVNMPRYVLFLKQVNSYVNKVTLSSGVNIAGPFTTESGAGVAARSFIRSMSTTGIPFVLNLLEDPLARSTNNTYRHLCTGLSPHSANILFANADQVPRTVQKMGPSFFAGKYTIGYWLWELETFPVRWKPSFRCLDEIWTQSEFCAHAIKEKTELPVIAIPHSISITNTDSARTRQSFGLIDESFVFLYTFSFHSVFERKNPLALIESFKKAFRGFKREKTTLVLKLSGSAQHQWAYNEIIKSSKGLPVIIVDSHLDESSLYRLMQLADCYVSLHRAEGFGLTMAESMYLGKPCIATGYSGNMDFMDDSNSYLVKYNMRKIEQSVGPYTKGHYWAEPDVSHAADLMRFVYENPRRAIDKGAKAARDIRQNLSPEAIGRKIQKQMKEHH
jgi:glycosyltransferase involved in cell wall biosynthesis